MTTSGFKKYYDQLNAEQKKAVDAVEGPVMVIAGPGTGKTQILTLRIANILLKTQVEPENILALTFTESGVASMRNRLASMIGSPAYRVAISTFHSFANDAIQNYPESFLHIIGAHSSTDMEQIDIMRAVIDVSKVKILKPFGDRYHYVKSVRSAIKDLKKEGVSPDDLKKIIGQERKGFEKIDDLYYEKGVHKGKMKGKYQDIQRDIERNAELAVLYAGYQDELKTRKLYDYEDMLIEFRNALMTNDELLITLQEQYHYFLVDEHQDTNKAQNKILELLASFHDNPNIFIVGDEKQAIFRFQGASLENFLYFKNKFSEAKLITLTQNYRSTQNILDIADTKLIAQKKYTEKPIAISAFSSPDVERYAVGQELKKLIADEVQPGEIAILYRENREAFPLGHMLGKLGVPYVIESDLDILQDATIKKLLLILRAINSYGEPLPLIEAMHVDFLHIDQLKIYEIAQSRVNPYVAIADSELGKLMKEWKRIADNESLELLFENVIRSSGLLAQLVSDDPRIEALEKVTLLYDQIKALAENRNGITLKEFIGHIDTLAEHGVAIRYTPKYHTDAKVHLMTAHRSKGLEFEHVFIINVVDKIWGNRRMFSSFNLPVPTTPDDDKNLFYVAMTRAKKEIHISYAEMRSDGREQLVSQFVSELKPELVERIDVKNIELAYQKDVTTLFAEATTHSGPNVHDKEFLKNLFLNRGFSASHLNNYLDCPWHYFYVNLLRIPQAPTPSQYFGTAMHKALESLFLSPSQPPPYSKGEAKEGDRTRMLDALRVAIAESRLAEQDKPEYLERGLAALSGYYDTYHKHWNTNVLKEFTIKGLELTPEIKLTGKLDKIELLENNKVVVVDYKTGEAKSRNALEGKTKGANGNEKRQLVFYKLLLDKYADGKYKMQSGVIDFVEPNDSGKYKREEFLITDDECRSLEEEIKKVADEILNLKFWDKKCNDRDCQWCNLRGMMR